MYGYNVLLSILARRTGKTRLRHVATFGFADAITGAVGSWPFVIVQAILITIWITGNSRGWFHFDPYPFILLNLGLSFQAAFTAPFILISQNRQGEIDRATLLKDLHTDTDIQRMVRRLLVLMQRAKGPFSAVAPAPATPPDDIA